MENVIEIMLNFKKLRFKLDENIESIQWISQRFSGVGKYTSDDIKLSSGIDLLSE
jgi:DNA-directed RNA polymerase alpha subunit